MTPSDFHSIQNDVHTVFSALYLIDAEHLSSDQRKQHQQALSVAYLAWVNAENARFELLSSQAKAELVALTGQVKAVRDGVSGLATPHEKLGVLAQGMDVLARLARLIP
ncbi:MAG: hypothetical protein KJ798_14790 [Gammaproteobacteria bacterium]|uniref:hypothetical protein n=1 Tax=Limnobacter sp. TaxID=2003368 RepID=UPI001DBDD158|nr:hypothetical protein [Limnobacter sp.]MBU0783569.1 hypothetical protein [Gammaproteobacteria bacterium]MBU0850302.1 hypothetical protein [Gammaproteobacteria bacterium]MBU1267093.1 hypothetical protein [Gammaproteobacteria bacterium]MBU1529135.1 hypothetical protein [Gammaproteobacteria bacterium]MBU1781639.1 hypothetical protein [Gammaproteobacteria bacterium]